MKNLEPPYLMVIYAAATVKSYSHAGHVLYIVRFVVSVIILGHTQFVLLMSCCTSIGTKIYTNHLHRNVQ
jgi:hypothetical protein